MMAEMLMLSVKGFRIKKYLYNLINEIIDEFVCNSKFHFYSIIIVLPFCVEKITVQ